MKGTLSWWTKKDTEQQIGRAVGCTDAVRSKRSEATTMIKADKE
jgi:hypothetical protein